MTFHFYPYLMGLLITMFFIKLITPLAHRLGLIDVPGGRRKHHSKIPLIGGIAMFLGFVFTLLSIDISFGAYRSFFSGAMILIIVGVLDDFHELSPKMRLFAQLIVGLIMTVWGGNVIHHLGYLFFTNNIIITSMGVPFTIICLIGMINAVNMTDGENGLAAGLAIIQSIFLMLVAAYAGLNTAVQILTVFITVLLGFLCFNFNIIKKQTASVFMGDAGSMFIGFVLTWFCVELSQHSGKFASPIVFCWIMGVPLIDMLFVVIRRLQTGHSPFHGDRQHLHHLLADFGIHKTLLVLLICLASVILGGIGFYGHQHKISDGVLLVSFISLFLVYYIIMSWALGQRQSHVIDEVI